MLSNLLKKNDALSKSNFQVMCAETTGHFHLE